MKGSLMGKKSEHLDPLTEEDRSVLAALHLASRVGGFLAERDLSLINPNITLGQWLELMRRDRNVICEVGLQIHDTHPGRKS